MPSVDGPLAFDLGELLGGVVVRLDRFLELNVERMDLVQDSLRLGSLG
jgi:hypothetical protein